MYTRNTILLVLAVALLAVLVVQPRAEEYMQSVDDSLASSSKIIDRLHGELQEFTRHQEPDIYSILLGGDIMLDRGVESKIMAAGGDYSYPFMNINSVIREATVAFANVESAVSDRGVDSGKPYSFRIPSLAAQAIADSGLDVVSIANNHSLDWGYDALCDTVNNLQAVGLKTAGAGCNESQAERSATISLPDGTQIAILAYTEFYAGAYAVGDHPGFSHYDLDNMQQSIIRERAAGADLVLVSLHWGIEYKPRSNEAQQTLAHILIDSGADMIIGHHPHVPQEIERYGDGWIVYSLGNFVFDQSWSEETMRGLLVRVSVQSGEITDVAPLPILLNSEFQPGLV